MYERHIIVPLGTLWRFRSALLRVSTCCGWGSRCRFHDWAIPYSRHVLLRYPNLSSQNKSMEEVQYVEGNGHLLKKEDEADEESQ